MSVLCTNQLSFCLFFLNEWTNLFQLLVQKDFTIEKFTTKTLESQRYTSERANLSDILNGKATLTKEAILIDRSQNVIAKCYITVLQKHKIWNNDKSELPEGSRNLSKCL